MKRMIQMYSVLGITNAILIPVGLTGPSPDWAAFFAGGLTLACIFIVGMLWRIDRKARKDFMRALTSFRQVCSTDPIFLRRIEQLEDMVKDSAPLVTLAHEIGYLNGKLVEKGLMRRYEVERPEVVV